MDSSATSKGATEPPPPYRDNCTPPPLAGPSGLPSNHGSNFPFILDEDSALLMKHQLRRRRVLRRLSYALGFILLVISILQNLSLVSCPLDDVSASTKRAKRREWKAQMKEHEVLVGQWATERELHEQEVYGWDLERLQWQEERQKWEQERKDEERHRKEVERKRQGVFWTDAVGDAHCSAYGTRVYRAALKDIPSGLNWLEVCSDMPNNVHGRLTDRPDECWRDDHGEVHALWRVNWDEPACIPYWDTIHNKGCAQGKPGLAHFEARLWGISQGDDWESMCATTPAHVGGLEFDHPTACDNRGGWVGMIGIWEAPYKWC